MCVPKYYMRPLPSPQQLSPLLPVDLDSWGEMYTGPAATSGSATLYFAPDSSPTVRGVMLLLAKAAACPPDAAHPHRFHCLHGFVA